MSKPEIVTELPKPDELAGEQWIDGGELTDADKADLDTALADYERNPDAGSSWEEVEARLRAKLHP